MAKTFYTERDIEDMVHHGNRSLMLHDDIVLTDMAYEKARTLGLKLVREQESVPCAPVRPYLAKSTSGAKTAPIDMAAVSTYLQGEKQAQDTVGNDELQRRIRTAVLAKVGDIDVALLDRIIFRVLENLGLRKS